jgi:hypothetical protein
LHLRNQYTNIKKPKPIHHKDYKNKQKNLFKTLDKYLKGCYIKSIEKRKTKEAKMKFVKLTSPETMTRYINLDAIRNIRFMVDSTAAAGIEVEWTSGRNIDDSFENFEGWEAERILEAVEAITH